MMVSDPAKLWLLGTGSGEERRGAGVVAASGETRSLLHRRGGHQVNPASKAIELCHPLPRGVPLKVQSVDGKAEVVRDLTWGKWKTEWGRWGVTAVKLRCVPLC